MARSRSIQLPSLLVRTIPVITLLATLFLLPARNALATGSLSVSGGAPGNLAVTLSGATQEAYATLAGYQASDTTGTGAGWNITIQATQFVCTAGVGFCPAGGSALPLDSLLLAAPAVTCASGTSCTGTSSPPSITISSNSAIDTGGSGVKVASAAVNTGEGTYNFTPGAVDGNSSHNLVLTVPSSAYATTYNSTLTISIINGP